MEFNWFFAVLFWIAIFSLSLILPALVLAGILLAACSITNRVLGKRDWHDTAPTGEPAAAPLDFENPYASPQAIGSDDLWLAYFSTEETPIPNYFWACVLIFGLLWIDLTGFGFLFVWLERPLREAAPMMRSLPSQLAWGISTAGTIGLLFLALWRWLPTTFLRAAWTTFYFTIFAAVAIFGLAGTLGGLRLFR